MTTSIYDELKINAKFPIHSEYKELLQLAETGEDAFETDNGYKESVITKFMCEEQNEYNERVAITPVRNYCADIIYKYNSQVYSNDVIRPESMVDFSQDCDGLGTTLTDFNKKVLLDAQVEGRAFVLLNEDKLSRIEIESVLNWNIVNNKMIEVAVLFYEEDGQAFINYYNQESYARIDGRIKGNDFIVESIGELQELPYPIMPIFKVEPFNETSQISPMAVQQASIVNLLSLLYTEVTNQAFTRFILSNVRIPEDENGQPKQITFGSKRITVFSDSDVKVDRIGADISQAESIRSSIKEEEMALFRAAGLTASSYNVDSAVPESGLSRLVGLQSYFTKCTYLAKAMQEYEALVAYCLNPESYDEVKYDTEYSEETSMSQDLQELRDLLSLDFDESIKQKAKEAFLKKWYP